MKAPEKEKQFKELIEKNKGIFYKVSRLYCQNETDREDLLQEILIQIWNSFDKYDEKYKISTWLYRISLNTAISFYRKNASRIKKTSSFNEDEIINEEGSTNQNEIKLRLLIEFINELSEIDKSLILLYLEDKSHIEISEILGLSVSNVGTKIGRIKEKLKIQFLKHGEKYDE
ncbi:MAG: RNA polymerase sigma factor [Ignavibacteriaceae bacterium]|nr:RNA polymerase sigma factor [Ignavibacteriaceae bacterium]